MATTSAPRVRQQQTGMTCAACSGRIVTPAVIGGQVHRNLHQCRKCGGVHGMLYRGEARQIFGLDQQMASASDAPRYFNLTVLGSEGIAYVHGWFDEARRSVVQYG
jgi:hypothetical protein